MSTEKGDTSEVDGSAPLDLRVKKEVKPERTTPIQENVPLNLSKPVSTPAPTPGQPPAKILKTDSEAPDIRSMPGGPAVRASAPPPLVKHATIAGNGSKSVPVRPPFSTAGGPMPQQMALVSQPNAVVPGAASLGKKQAPSLAPHPYSVPPHAIALETVVGSPKIPVGAESNHTSVTSGTSSPVMYGGPPKAVKTAHGTSPTVSPSKGGPRPMMTSTAAVPVIPEHYVPAPSPRSKKKTSPVPMDNPEHAVSASQESSAAKVSPSRKMKQPNQDKQASLPPHALQAGIQAGIPTSMDRLVAQASPRRLLPSAGSYPGNSQKYPSGHPPQGASFPPELPPRPRVPHRKKSPVSPPPSSLGTASQGHAMTAAAVQNRDGLPQQVSPRGMPRQHLPHRLPVGTLPHVVHAPPVEALLRPRHPVTAVSQAEGVPLYSARASRPPGTHLHVGPHGPPPALSQAPHHPTPPRPSPPRPSPPRPTAQPHTATQVPNHSPSSSSTSSSTSSTSQPHSVAPPFRDIHHAERMRHPGAGQGYIPPRPPSSEFYPMRPRGPQPSSTTGTSRPPGVPALVQTPGPSMQATGQRFPASSAPFAVNPFVSLSIAIDCQRATEQDSDGDTALHIAIVQDKPDMGLVRRLIELVRLAGKSVDIFNFMQQTPLHLACIMKDADVIRLLVEAGSNPNEADRNGQTAAHHTCKSGTPSCLGAILRYSQMEVNLNIRNYEGYTPLHLAAMIGNPTLVTMLLEKGADLNSKDSKNGWTPLFHAVTNQDTKLVHKMLSSGAEVNVQSYSGNTVLHVATGRGFTDIVKILVHYGADMSLKNTQWDTPATITTDKNMSSLLRGLGAGSPQPNDSSSPSTPAPTLPMPLNDAYLIHPPASASTSAPAASTPSKPPSTVTTMTTERLKGPANEVYEVTRHVTHQDAKSPDGGQRAIHKQTQERLRHSIQYRNERRSESYPRKPTDNIPPGQPVGNEKLLLVQLPARREEKEGGVQMNVNEQYGTVKATSTPDVVPKIEISSPGPVSKPDAPFKNNLNQKLVTKPSEQNTKYVMTRDPSESITHQLVINVNGHLRTLPLKADRKVPSLGVPIAPKGTEPRRIILKERRPKESMVEAATKQSPHTAEGSKRSGSTDSSSPSSAQPAPGTSESENELRARMLSLQYKNSDAILGNKYERKLDSVGSEQEHEVANTILTIGSRLREQERERHQKSLQTCDADSTVKTEPVSPSPVLSSTTIDNASVQSQQTGVRLSPPVLEREGDRPVNKPVEGEKGDDGELNLVIDESQKSKSRKRTRTPTKSIPNLSPAKSSATTTTTSSSSASDYVATSSDSVKLGKVKVMAGDPKKIWTKKALAMMGSQEPKRKRKKSEKSSKEN